MPSSCSLPCHAPQDTGPRLWMRAFGVHEQHAEIDNVKGATTRIEPRGNRPLEPSATQCGCGSVEMAFVDREILDHSGRDIDPDNFESNGINRFAGRWRLISEQRHEGFTTISEVCAA